VFGTDISAINWVSWSVAVTATLYVIFAKNPYDVGTREYKGLRLCRISLALLAWGISLGLFGVAFAFSSFVFATMGIMKGRNLYGFLLLIGCVCAPVLAFSGGILGFPGTGFHIQNTERRKKPPQIEFRKPILETHKIVRGKILTSVQPEATPPNEFDNNIDDLYWKLVSLFVGGRIEEASQILDLFKEHGKLDYKDVKEFYKEAKIDHLERRVRSIPASQVLENLKIYEELLRLDPGNSKYKRKVSHYKSRAEQ
jgi:hypothetical protein